MKRLGVLLVFVLAACSAFGSGNDAGGDDDDDDNTPAPVASGDAGSSDALAQPGPNDGAVRPFDDAAPSKSDAGATTDGGPGQLVFHGIEGRSTSDGTTITLRLPPAHAIGDLLVAVIDVQGQSGAPGLTPPSDWQNVVNQTEKNYAGIVISHVVKPTDSRDDIVLMSGTSFTGSAFVAAYGGATKVVPGHKTDPEPNTISIVSPPRDPSAAANDMFLLVTSLFANANGIGIGTPQGFTAATTANADNFVAVASNAPVANTSGNGAFSSALSSATGKPIDLTAATLLTIKD